jgi:hypothetical protein
MKKTRFCGAVLILLLTLQILPVSAEEAEFVVENGTLTAYNGGGGDVAVPDGVTAIGDYAFFHCRALARVVLPEGVRAINRFAFYDCAALESVVLPEGLQTIGDGAFGRCEQLGRVAFPSSLQSIGKYAFEACRAGRNRNRQRVPNGARRHA